jgi:DNA-binding NtrC family response regulator
MNSKIKKILIADDDDGIIDTLSLWIESKAMFKGVVIRIAKTAEDAKALILNEAPELIFLDLGLGNGLSGLQLLKDLKLDQEKRSKVFVFSGYTEYEAECLTYGATAFIKKGTKLKVIEGIIQNNF